MSINFIGSVWDSGLYDGPRLLMMLALADHADDDGWCFPNYDTLALKIRRDVKTVYRVLSDLEKKGAIRRLDGRIGICEPEIIEEVNRRADKAKAKQAARKNENKILKTENDVLTNENSVLTNENEILNSEKPFLIDPSINRQENREERESAPPPVPDDLHTWFKDNKIPEPRSAADLALVRSAPARLWLNITMRWPGWSGLRRVVESLGPQPDEAALRATQRIWETNSYSPRNIAGFLERYHAEAANADRPAPNSKGRSTGPSSTPEGVEKAHAWLAAALAGEIQ